MIYLGPISYKKPLSMEKQIFIKVDHIVNESCLGRGAAREEMCLCVYYM